MFCKNCGNEINEGIKFCPNCGNAIEAIKNTANKNTVEIQGDFPIAQSKIPLELLEGEKLILQYNVAIISKFAANGILSLTNKRILIKKDSFGKASLKSAGLLTSALMSSVKVVPEIKLSNIATIQAATIRGQKSGAEIMTKDGYTHRIIFQSMKIFSKEPINIRDSFVALIQTAISKEN